MKVTGSRLRTNPGRTEWIAVMRRRKTSGARRALEAGEPAEGVEGAEGVAEAGEAVVVVAGACRPPSFLP